jgi:tetratricopeptide (TPR) repeat protein
MHPPRTALLAALLAAATWPAATAAQRATPIRDTPPAAWSGCPAPAPAPDPTPADRRQEAERLAGEATQASILGDAAAALELLQRAATLDPASAGIAYRLARTLEQLGRRDDAIAGYCRYLALADDAPDAPDVRTRLAELAGSGDRAVPTQALQAFALGLAHYDGDRLPEAEIAFGSALRLAPLWTAPVYNRGLVRLARGRQDAAAEDFRAFLAMNPGEPQFSTALELLAAAQQGTVPAATARPYNPGSALAAGLLVPGLGHFTTGRTGTGVVVLGTAVGALTTGLLIRRTEVDCLSPPTQGRCPPGDVQRERVARPLLLPAAGVAAAAAVVGAVDAWRGARSRNERAALRLRTGSLGAAAPTVALMAVGIDGSAITISLMQLRF